MSDTPQPRTVRTPAAPPSGPAPDTSTLPGAVVVIDDTLPEADRTAIARRIGAPVRLPSDGVVGPNVWLATAAVDFDRLAPLMDRAYLGYVEVGGFGDLPLGPLGPAPGRLLLILKTRHAYGMDTAALLSRALTARGAMPSADPDDFHLAMHEAIANAVVHGNLGIGSELRTDPRGLLKFARLVSERLKDPDHGSRPLIVDARWDTAWLEVAVKDHGDGYDHGAVSNRSDATAKHGRGLSIIRHRADRVDFADGGRSLICRFARGHRPADVP